MYRPFEKVLIRTEERPIWTPDFYGHQDPKDPDMHCLVGGGWRRSRNIIPYEGNEHLAGKTSLPDEHIVNIGDLVAAFDLVERLEDLDVALGKITGFNKSQSCGESYFEVADVNWVYIIPYEKFDTSKTMEELMEEVLMIDSQGRIIKRAEALKD